jgi:hypothetical protein
VAILIMLLAISTYVGLHIRKYDNIPLPIPDHEMVQKKHNTTVIINPNPNTTIISNILKSDANKYNMHRVFKCILCFTKYHSFLLVSPLLANYFPQEYL